ncbi:HAT, C-terminal dimerisation domain [Cinara cedri]|uniref:HAT, C-terminal dimerisation domain n=1 Tax=Cinara cedri TaxID=506608 RepID=A0A5E4NGS9_9HEMI|nr:HAT, C-terminal dimerisation domain [Cinara cedri]
MRSLSLLEVDDFENTTTCCEAAGYRRQLDRFETVFITVFWNAILERFNSTSKALQKSEIEKRCAAYINTFNKYDFLTNLILLSPEEITQKDNKLQEFYNDDLEKSFACECVNFRAYLQSINKNIDGVIELLILLCDNNLDTVFPNVDIALRILLYMVITNCSAERSFSTLKRVKNYLRVSIEGDKLNLLSLLAIETELVNKMDFDAIIDDIFNPQNTQKADEY